MSWQLGVESPHFTEILFELIRVYLRSIVCSDLLRRHVFGPVRCPILAGGTLYAVLTGSRYTSEQYNKSLHVCEFNNISPDINRHRNLFLSVNLRVRLIMWRFVTQMEYYFRMNDEVDISSEIEVTPHSFSARLSLCATYRPIM